MTIDLWGLSLQAINVLILVWLLSHVFWRPIAAAIAKRQNAVQAMLDAAKTTQANADAALTEVTEARAGIAAEREAVLAKAATEAQTATKAALDDARNKAASLAAAAKLAITRDTDAVRRDIAVMAADLSVDIAAKLLVRLATPALEATFLATLVEAIKQMTPIDRSALAGAVTGIDLVSATILDDDAKAKITAAVLDALGGSPKLNFVIDPEIVAGLEMRTPHFVLHNSWRSDLLKVAKELKHEV